VCLGVRECVQWRERKLVWEGESGWVVVWVGVCLRAYRVESVDNSERES